MEVSSQLAIRTHCLTHAKYIRCMFTFVNSKRIQNSNSNSKFKATNFVENILSTKIFALIGSAAKFVENILSTKIFALIEGIAEFVENILPTKIFALIECIKEFVENILSTKIFALIEGITEFVENILSTKIFALVGSAAKFVENILSTKTLVNCICLELKLINQFESTAHSIQCAVQLNC